jgi:oxygen-independent coproporphyrinogen-3 oxidase
MPADLPLSLYIHIPWCVRKCPYCDFNSHAAEKNLPEQAYVKALLADLEQDLPQALGRTVQTIFIGGGTPSLFSAKAIGHLLEGVAARVRLAPAAEITLEANPGTAEIAKFCGFHEAGVNRLSIGAQSFNDRHLQSLGRIHGGAEAAAAAAMAKQAGFDNFNLDLMFGLPRQTQAEAEQDIHMALALEPTHISFYQLTLEPNTLFHKYPPVLPADDDIWEIQEACQALLAKAEYRQYEVSAYAREGFRCRHNENYWRFGDYLGIGAGAHGKITDTSGMIKRIWKARDPNRYLDSAGTPASIAGINAVEITELPLEFLMNHLRLREGFAASVFTQRTRLGLEVLASGITACVNDGLLERRGDILRCTEKGWNFLDTVLEKFIDPFKKTPRESAH